MTTFTHQDGQYVEVAGARLYCEQQGNPQGPALVFLHGGFGDIETFNAITPALAERVRAAFWPHLTADGAHFVRPMHVRLLRRKG